MIRLLFIINFFTISLLANAATQMYQLYQKGEYGLSCDLGARLFNQFESNEAQISLFAFSCLKADRLDHLSRPIEQLNKSKEARANASYFSLLVLQKKLLLQALYDNYPIKSIKIPTSSHLLSKLFAFYQHDPQFQNSIKEYIDLNNPRISYKLYSIESNGRKTIAIDEYYDKILTLHHIY